MEKLQISTLGLVMQKKANKKQKIKNFDNKLPFQVISNKIYRVYM